MIVRVCEIDAVGARLARAMHEGAVCAELRVHDAAGRGTNLHVCVCVFEGENTTVNVE